MAGWLKSNRRNDFISYYGSITKKWPHTPKNMHFQVFKFDNLWYIRIMTSYVLVRRAADTAHAVLSKQGPLSLQLKMS